MPYLFKVSLPGYDVKTARPEQCAVHSGYNMPKIDMALDNFKSFTVNFVHEVPGPSVAGTALETIIFQKEHDYNYVPQCWVEVDWTEKLGASTFSAHGPGTALLGAAGAFDATYFGARCDNKYMYLYVRKESSFIDNSVLAIIGTSLKCRVYIFAEEGTDS